MATEMISGIAEVLAIAAASVIGMALVGETASATATGSADVTVLAAVMA